MIKINRAKKLASIGPCHRSFLAMLEAVPDAVVAKGVPESQAFMVACMAVKAEMPDTLENLIALRNIIREENDKHFTQRGLLA